MIDHVSVGVADLDMSSHFYESILNVLGITKIIEKPGTRGFGKKYPELWINHRPDKTPIAQDNGTHICFRARSIEAVDQFYKVAMDLGAESSGKPGYRTEYYAPDYRDQKFKGYYAAFIKDKDHNHIEVVTFV